VCAYDVKTKHKCSTCNSLPTPKVNIKRLKQFVVRLSDVIKNMLCECLALTAIASSTTPGRAKVDAGDATKKMARFDYEW
jgi:hypothetical protein